VIFTAFIASFAATTNTNDPTRLFAATLPATFARQLSSCSHQASDSGDVTFVCPRYGEFGADYARGGKVRCQTCEERAKAVENAPAKSSGPRPVLCRCGRIFVAVRSSHVHHSHACRQAAYEERRAGAAV
jgi:hypothetical protein